MNVNLDKQQVEYIDRIIKEHLFLSREYIRELWRTGYEVDFAIDDLKFLKSISSSLKSCDQEQLN